MKINLSPKKKKVNILFFLIPVAELNFKLKLTLRTSSCEVFHYTGVDIFVSPQSIPRKQANYIVYATLNIIFFFSLLYKHFMRLTHPYGLGNKRFY